MILNFTGKEATQSMLDAGVVELNLTSMIVLQTLMYFEKQPTCPTITACAKQIAVMANAELKNHPDSFAMLGGDQHWMLPFIEKELKAVGVNVIYGLSWYGDIVGFVEV